MFRDKLALLALTPLAVYWVLCLSGVVQFHLWQQVVSFREILDDGELDVLGHMHAMRYSLVSPIFVVGEWLGVSYDWLFSIIVPVQLLIITYFSTRSVIALSSPLNRQRRAMLIAGISSFLILLSLFMNGRLIFSFVGTSILMWSLLNWERNSEVTNFYSVVLAIYFSCVSSGTFLIVTFSFYFFLFVNIVIRNSRVCQRKILLIYSLLIVLITPFLSMAVIKVLEFYGGGVTAIVGILGHGYGTMLLQTNLFIMLPVLALVFFIFYRCRDLLLRNWVLASLVLIYLTGGMFGYSTGLVVLLPLLVIAGRSLLLVLDKILGSKVAQTS